nr:MAG TPA: hypothetical protein [Bacteriophage sp.]
MINDLLIFTSTSIYFSIIECSSIIIFFLF